MEAARDRWYPSGELQMGDFTSFHMTFHLPRWMLQVVADGAGR